MIEFENVTKIYRKSTKPALDEVNLKINKGEFVFIIGPSGSGKSTFLNLILREQKLTKGKILVAGQDLASVTPWRVSKFRRKIGCVFQDFQLLPNKSVYGNVAFALEVVNTPREEIKTRVRVALDKVGLSGKSRRRIEELSGGERQRVAIARAIVNRPELILADEPTGNLDPEISEEIMALLTSINDEGTTVVMATHDVNIVNSMQKRVIGFEHGFLTRDQIGGLYKEEDVK